MGKKRRLTTFLMTMLVACFMFAVPAAAEEDYSYHADLRIQKVDAQCDDSEMHGDQNLAGAKFMIINGSDSHVRNHQDLTIQSCGYTDPKNAPPTYAQLLAKANEMELAHNSCIMGYITTDASGLATTEELRGSKGLRALPQGTFYFIEVEAPAGYHVNEEWVGYVHVRHNDIIYGSNNPAAGDGLLVTQTPSKRPDGSIPDTHFVGGVKLTKVDGELFAEGASQKTQGYEGTLAGAKFAIINASEKGTAMNYEGKEVPSAVKAGALSATGTPTYAQLRALADAGTYNMQILTTDANGECQTSDSALEYGTYYIIEIESPKGYNIAENFIGKLCVRNDKHIYTLGEHFTDDSNPLYAGYFINVGNANVTEGNVVREVPRRRNMKFMKVTEDGEPKKFIPFLVEYLGNNRNGDAIEWHVVVTDEYGVVDTSDIAKRSREGVNANNVNRADDLVDIGTMTITPEGENQLVEASHWNIWFSNNGQLPATTPTNKDGCLNEGFYRITELHCKDNETYGETLVSIGPFEIKNDLYDQTQTVDDNQDPYEIPTIVDIEVLVKSDSADVESGTKTVPARTSVDVTDHIQFTNVSAKHEYAAVVSWRDLTTGLLIPLTGTKTQDAFLVESNTGVCLRFTPKGSTAIDNATQELDIQASMNTEQLRTHVIMAEIRLYQYLDPEPLDSTAGTWHLITQHPASGEEDENEKLFIPDIQTKVQDGLTGSRVAAYDEQDLAYDEVSYMNLSTNEPYVIEMTLLNGDTGEPIETTMTGAPRAVYSQVIFDRHGTPVSGSVQLPEFVFDSTKFAAGTSIVVSEKLYRASENGRPYGEPLVVHDSLLDEDETLRFVHIHTTASDKNTKDDVGTVEESAVVYDTVKLSNVVFDDDDLRSDYKYKLVGRLVYQQDFTDADGVEHKAGEEVPTLDGTLNEVTIHSNSLADGEMVYNDGTPARGKFTIRGYGKNAALKVDSAKPNDVTYIEDKMAMIADIELELEFHIDASKMEGATTVVFEKLYHDGNGRYTIEVSRHEDLTDKGQQIHYPKVRTHGVDDATKDDVGHIGTDVTLTDTVTLTNLVPGRMYTVKGTLKDQKTGEDFLLEGHNVTVSTDLTVGADGTLTAAGGQKTTVTRFDEAMNQVDGTVDLVFHLNVLDEKELEDRTTVVFEDLYHNGIRVAFHNDLSDKDQTVHYPKIRTTLVDRYTEDHVGTVTEKAVLVDTVKYNNLVIGREYTVSGTLMNKKTGEKLLDSKGNEVTNSVTFTAGDESDIIKVTERDEEHNYVSGTVDVVFEFDASLLEDTTTVAFEKLIHNGIEVTVHEELDDEDQTVHFPKIRTSAVDAQTKDDVGTVAKTQIVDTVKFWNLIPGMEYTVSGVLMDRDTGEKLLLNGKPVVQEAVITVNADGTVTASKGERVVVTKYDKKMNRVDGTVDLTYELDASTLEERTLVVFEDLLHKKVVVTSHADITDNSQTVHFPKVRTNAVDDSTKDDVGRDGTDVTITDTVTLKNLVMGRTYTVKGTLKEQQTGEDFLIDGHNVTVTTDIVVSKDGTITAKGGQKTTVTHVDEEQFRVDGTADLVFNLAASAVEQLEGRTTVVFEDLYHNNVRVAFHNDLKDKSQTVHFPKIRTTLVDDYTKDHVATVTEKAVLVDTVKYNNLVIGREYTLYGVLMNKNTGKPLLDAQGNEVRQSRTFTAGDEGDGIVVTKRDTVNNFVDGSVDIIFEFDASLLEGTTVVAYERLEHNHIDVAVHEDLTDEDQVVHFPKIRTNAVDGKTRDDVGTVDKTQIIDTVSFWNLLPGMTYEVSGTLMNKDTGEKLLVNGKEVVQTAEITVHEDGTVTGSKGERIVVTEFNKYMNSVSGTVDLVYDIDASMLENYTVVVFEDLYHNKVKVTSHADLSDLAQTVHFPKIRTNAIDVDTSDHAGTVKKDAVVRDKVSYWNLVIGREYTIQGTLMNRDTGAPILNEDGTLVTAEATFVATTTPEVPNYVTKVYEEDHEVDGYYILEFHLDSRVLAGRTVVVFEDLYHNGIRVTTHSDLNDEEQSVHYPQIRTTATDRDTGDHVGSIWGALMNGVRHLFGEKDADGNGIADDVQANINDVVKLENLVPGYTYVVSGKIYDVTASREAGENVPLVIDGEEVTQCATITVAEDGSAILAPNGEKTEVTAYDKTKNRVDGNITLVFSFDSSKVQEHKLVVFEDLYHDSTYKPDLAPDTVKPEDLVHQHANLDDEDQSVSEVQVKTTAVDTKTGDHVGSEPTETEPSIIRDTVNMKQLLPGMEYELRGVLVELNASDLENGKIVYMNADGTLTENREEAYEERTIFTAEKEDEVHYLNFALASDRAQGRALTVFEFLYHNDTLIAAHPSGDGDGWSEEDFSAQTVYYPTGKTNATDNDTEKHTTFAESRRVITDRVYFENLVVGEKYQIVGQLMYKTDFVDAAGVSHKAGDPLPETGRAVEIVPTLETLAKVPYVDSQTGEMAVVDTYSVRTLPNGQAVATGYVRVEFHVDASKLAGATLVAFETFKHNDVDVFTHKNLNDLPQTVKIPKIATSARTGELDEAAVYDENGAYREIEIVDTVSYWNLWTTAELKEMSEQGKHIYYKDGTIMDKAYDIYDIDEDGHYIIHGVLMDKSTGEPLVNAKGETYEVYSEPFEVTEKDGTYDITFKLNPADFVVNGKCELEGKTLVVFEDLYEAKDKEGTEDKRNHVAMHHDIDDAEQDIRIPKGRTHAQDGIPQDVLANVLKDYPDALRMMHDGETVTTGHEVYAATDITLTDIVAYENLHGGTKYTVTAQLMLVTETDENGVPTKYEPAVDDHGNLITATAELDTSAMNADFNASVSGYIPVIFKFDGATLVNKTMVAFEKFTREGQDVIVHHDITDSAQTVFMPSIKTHASDAFTGLNESLADANTVILDRVTYENLEEGKTYTLKATLHRKSDGTLVDGDGTEGTFVAGVENQYIFRDGTRVMTHDQMVALLGGMKETTKWESESVIMANDEAEQDAAQNSGAELNTSDHVEYVVGKDIPAGYYKITPGTASDGTSFGYWCIYYDVNGGIPANRTTDTTLTNGIVTDNEVNYIRVEENMVLQLAAWCNTNYQQVTASEAEPLLVDAVKRFFEKKAENDQVQADAEATTTEVSAQPVSTGSPSKMQKRVSGEVYVVIPVDASELKGDAVVAFETLYGPEGNGSRKPLASHEDLNDEEQTVYFPEIRTRAKINGKKTIEAGKDATLLDTVTYKNLVPGREYHMRGELMDKVTGKSVGVTAETSFTPETPDGKMKMEFLFETKDLGGHELVVFEELVRRGEGDDDNAYVIAEHKDIEDAAQTVSIQKPKEDIPTEHIDTGDKPVRTGVAVASAVLVALLAMVLVLKRRMRRA